MLRWVFTLLLIGFIAGVVGFAGVMSVATKAAQTISLLCIGLSILVYLIHLYQKERWF